MNNVILCIELNYEGFEIIENLTMKLKKRIKGSVQFSNRDELLINLGYLNLTEEMKAVEIIDRIDQAFGSLKGSGHMFGFIVGIDQLQLFKRNETESDMIALVDSDQPRKAFQN